MSAKCTACCSCSISSSTYVSCAPEATARKMNTGKDQYYLGRIFRQCLISETREGTNTAVSVTARDFLLKKRCNKCNFQGFKWPDSPPAEALRSCSGQDQDASTSSGSSQHSGDCVTRQLCSEICLLTIHQTGLRKSSSLAASSPQLKTLTLLIVLPFLLCALSSLQCLP